MVDDGLAVDGRAEFRAARQHSAHDPGIDGERHQVVDPLFVGHVSHDVGEADAEVDHAARQELHGCPTRDDLPVVEDKGGQHPRGNPDLTGEGGIVLDTPGLHVMPRLRHHHRVHEHAGDTHLARVESAFGSHAFDLADHVTVGVLRGQGHGEVLEDERLALHGDVAVGVGGGAPDEGHVDGRPFVE